MAVITSAQRVVDAARKLSDAVGDVHEKNVRDLVDRDVRQRALHKLTDREREVLGLTA